MNWILASVNVILHGGFIVAAFLFFRKPARVPTVTAGLVFIYPGIALVGAWAIASSQPAPAQSMAAGVLAMASLLLFVWAARTVGRHRLPVCFAEHTPRVLIASGPYRFIRNPFYTAYLLAHAFPVVASGNLWLLGIFAAMLMLYLAAARQEEREFLCSPIRAEYLAYLWRTGRFLPRIVSLRSAHVPEDPSTSR